MYSPRFELSIFNGPLLAAPAAVDVAIFRAMLEALVQVNEIHLRAHPEIPSVEDAIRTGRVRYDDPGANDDPWRDCLRVLQMGEGDCEDLVAWFVAQLRVRSGQRQARAVFDIWPTPEGTRLIHIRATDGRKTYDPSRWAGMR